MSGEKGSDLPQKSAIALREEEILAFWEKEKIFEKSVEKDAPRGDFVFYDGPPFATGLPHFGHILQSAIKDSIPRYRTMQGYRVVRRWGWDCHGLPLENIIEAELGIKTKREIEELGVATFNEAARAAVLRYADDWKRIIPRMGRWVDMEDDYKTMDTAYTESVWWSFKKLFDKGLIYEGFKGMMLCPRCGTTLSNFEVAQGYKDIEDISVYVKLPLEGDPSTSSGQGKTSLLVWTTTPWTLPGNAAAAINKDFMYVKVAIGEEFLILAKDRLSVLADGYAIVSEFSGKDLVGKRYTPPFPFYQKKDIKGKNKAWKIYHADYVSMEDGTGAVHLAPSYGAIDQELAEREGIPLIHHVNADGKFTNDVEGFVGLQVKPKGHHQDTDKKIVEALAQANKLYKQETLVHSYPHCWRCDTPLLNYAASSWFVKVSTLKARLVAENKKIAWVPDHTGSGRFNNLLETAPDWAISRSRYWGAPLPVWRNDKTGKIQVAGSIEELTSMIKKSGNTYIVMRHGEAKSNVEGYVDSGTVADNHLTELGKQQVAQAAEELRSRNIDLVVASPIIRAQDTAKLILKKLGLSESALMTDERLREVGFGEFSGKPREVWIAQFASYFERFNHKIDGAETFNEVRRRVGEFLFDIERRYTGKTVLIVTHAEPAWLIEQIAHRVSHAILAQAGKPYHEQEAYLANAAYREIAFAPYPHNADFEIDLHRPYIDEMSWGDPIGGTWKRVPEVFDCWYESGSMPYAQSHYPFEHTDRFNPKRLLGLSPKGYPADFIAEAVDQTRGWFYSLIVLGAALFSRAPYKHVITTGFVLAEDGRKMSKKLKNYPDPMELVAQYGADSMRYYMLASQLVRGEDLNFSARGVDEVSKKLLMRLENVRSFLFLYNGTALPPSNASEHVLDTWIIARLVAVGKEVTEGLESYALDAAVRPIGDFIDDLSTWYLRRSRDRFKGDDSADANAAKATLRFVLIELAKVMAPIMPFYAEYLYRTVKEDSSPESVHLCSWSVFEPSGGDAERLSHMHAVRHAVSLSLEARAKANIKVRQPLARVVVQGSAVPDEEIYKALIRDEVNVKEVRISKEGEGVELDITITPELKAEGLRRDLARLIQEFRKHSGLTVSDRPVLTIGTSEEGKEFIRAVEAMLVKETGLASIALTDASPEAALNKDLGFPIELTL